jgi:hypothetical protein
VGQHVCQKLVQLGAEQFVDPAEPIIRLGGLDEPLRLDPASLASRSSRISLASCGVSQDETFEICDCSKAVVVKLLKDDPSGVDQIRHGRGLGLIAPTTSPFLRHAVVEPLGDVGRYGRTKRDRKGAETHPSRAP